jgi:mRNA-degrading endonuclease RelE of RelBE toxin-antitoxin system
MTNREIIEWWDSKGIVERVNLREKYGFSNGASLDVDDYRIIYEAESKP